MVCDNEYCDDPAEFELNLAEYIKGSKERYFCRACMEDTLDEVWNDLSFREKAELLDVNPL